VTADDVKKVAAEYLALKDSVTGYLVPDQSAVAQVDDTPPPSSTSGELR
jgi:zinc protease